MHSPLQVPGTYLDAIDDVVKQAGGKPFDSDNRRTYAAMALYLDDAVGEVERVLRDRGMWDNVRTQMCLSRRPIVSPRAHSTRTTTTRSHE